MAVIASKKVVIESQDWQQNEMFAEQTKIVDSVFTSQDAIEGATAFAEKRAPNWKGC
jgi:enoyl-CoA hydratase